MCINYHYKYPYKQSYLTNIVESVKLNLTFLIKLDFFLFNLTFQNWRANRKSVKTNRISKTIRGELSWYQIVSTYDPFIKSRVGYDALPISPPIIIKLDFFFKLNLTFLNLNLNFSKLNLSFFNLNFTLFSY